MFQVTVFLCVKVDLQNLNTTILMMLETIQDEIMQQDWLFGKKKILLIHSASAHWQHVKILISNVFS